MQNASVAAEISMPLFQWINVILLGMLCGAIGQGARTIVSLKKISDAAQELSVSTADLIRASKLVTAFLIGAVAGALAAITLVEPNQAMSLEQVFELIAAGYIGADFIEGFITRISPSDDKPKNNAADADASPSPQPASDGALG